EEAIDVCQPIVRRRREGDAAEDRPLDAEAVLVVGEIGEAGDHLIVVGPARIGGMAGPEAGGIIVTDVAEHADIVEAAVGQKLEVLFEPLALVAIAGERPEEGGAERIEPARGGDGGTVVEAHAARTRLVAAPFALELERLPGADLIAVGRDRAAAAPFR